MRFEGNVALVVGAGAGMGRATAVQLIKEGAHVIGFDLRDDDMDELKDEVKDEAGTFEAFVGDVNDPQKRKAAVEFIKKKYGRLDTLAYIAGVMDAMTPVHLMDDELWNFVMDVNVNSVFRMVRDTLPLLKDHEDRAANILIVGSIGGIYHSTAGAAYVTSKHAVRGLMKHLAYSYRENNIRVNGVNPGAIASSILETSMLKWPDRDLFSSEGRELFGSKGANTLRADELLGEPEDIAAAICFLLSDDAKFVSGAEITVDGGWTSF